MRKILIITIVTLAVTAFLTQVVKIYVSNSNALESVEATHLRAAIDTSRDNNMSVEAEVLKYSSLNAVASRAAELGYTNSRDIVSVYDPQPVSLAR